MDQNFLHPTILSIVHYICPSILENWFGTILQKIYGWSFTKKPFGALEKWKMVFSSKENENFLRQHCLPFQYTPLCTIWDHLNKLCHECGHKIDHLAWKPWIFTHDSSFLRTLFKNNCRITSLLFFLETWSHIMNNAKVFQFFDFFWIFYARFKMRSKRRAWPFLASGWILEFFWCFSD